MSGGIIHFGEVAALIGQKVDVNMVADISILGFYGNNNDQYTHLHAHLL